MTIRAVVFDVGECLVDETREYGTWADWLGVPATPSPPCSAPSSPRAATTGTSSRSSGPASTSTNSARPAAAAGRPEHFGEDDLYPDVRPALAQLRADGLWLGIAGNQTVRAGGILRELFTEDVDLIGTSDDWGPASPIPSSSYGSPRSCRARTTRSSTSATASTTTSARGRGRDGNRARAPRPVGDDPVADRGSGEAPDLPGREPHRTAGGDRPVQRTSALTVVSHPYNWSSRSRTHGSCCHGIRARRTSRTRSMPVAYQVSRSCASARSA